MEISLPKGRIFLRYWLPVLVWCGVMLALSGDLGSDNNTGKLLHWLLPTLSPAHFELIHFYLRKGVGHIGDYGFLYFLWFRAFRGGLGYRGGRAFLWSLGLCWPWPSWMKATKACSHRAPAASGMWAWTWRGPPAPR